MSQHKSENRNIKAMLAGSVACSMIMAMAAPAHANSCNADKDDLKAAVSAIKDAVSNADKNMKSAYKSATSTSYSDAYFDNQDEINEKAEYAYELVSEYYDIGENMKQLAEGEMQKKLPPVVTNTMSVVTNTMSNAVELAQAAMDEENSKLDIAQVRCSQDLSNTALTKSIKDAGGADMLSNFYDYQKKACKAVQVLADLQRKYEQLQEFRENGYPLFYLHQKDKKDFNGKERTVQFKVDLRMYPEYPDSEMGVNGEDQKLLLGQIEGIRLSYNTYFKWSDNNWRTINLYQFLMDDEDNGMVCVDMIKISDKAKAALCAEIQNIDTKKEELKLATAAKFKFNDKKRTVDLPTVVIPMPFGYLADVSDMKDKAMQNVKSEIAEQLEEVIKEFVDASEVANAVQESCDL